MCGKLPRIAPSWPEPSDTALRRGELHGPVMTCVLLYALPAPVAYERPAGNSLYVLVWCYLRTCFRARYRGQAPSSEIPRKAGNYLGTGIGIVLVTWEAYLGWETRCLRRGTSPGFSLGRARKGINLLYPVSTQPNK